MFPCVVVVSWQILPQKSHILLQSFQTHILLNNIFVVIQEIQSIKNVHTLDIAMERICVFGRLFQFQIFRLLKHHIFLRNERNLQIDASLY